MFSVEAETAFGKGVFVAGSWNKWTLSTDQRLEWNEGNVWKITLELPEGEYEYKFVIADYETAENPDWDTLNADNREIKVAKQSGEEPIEEPEVESAVNVVVNLTVGTKPVNNVSLVKDINRSYDEDWINDKGLPWDEMTDNGGGKYSITVSDLKKGDELRFVFATWVEGSSDIYIVGSSDWKPYKMTVGSEDVALNVTVSEFTSGAVFTVSVVE